MISESCKICKWNKDALDRTEIDDTGVVDIQKGVRQGCVLSSLFFILHSEENF